MKSIKKQISKIDFIYNFYHFHISGRLKNNPTELIRRTFKFQSNVFFIQVGSNDGKTGDPIYPLVKKYSKYRGLFVEPIPYLFERLQDNYSFRKDLLFENAAINDGISQTFYWIDPSVKEKYPDLPPWFDQLGSFKESHVYGAPGVSDILLKYRKESLIRGITFQDLLDKNNISNFDILHIDTEGYDYKVLSQVDFNKYQPKIVLYEHKCLTSEEKASAVKILSQGYNLNDIGADMFCTRKY